MISVGIASSVDQNGIVDDGKHRLAAAFTATFNIGSAWHGGQSAIFLKTDRSIDDVFARVVEALDDRDLLLIVEIADTAAVRYAGARFDEEAFDTIFPRAAELNHANAWAAGG